MKKSLSILLVLTLITGLFAMPSIADKKDSHFVVKEMTKKEKIKFLDSIGLELEDVVDLGIDYLDTEELKSIASEITKKGNKEVFNGVFVYKVKSDNNDVMGAVEPGPGGGSGVTTYEYTTSSSKTREHDASAGLKAVVSTTFSIYIGSKTKHIWKVLDILNVGADLFSYDYHSGDYSYDIITTWTTTKTYQGIPEWSSVKQDLVKVTRAHVEDFNKTVGVGPAPDYDEINLQRSKDYYYYSSHYYDTSWIYDMIDYVSSGSFPRSPAIDSL